MKRRFKVQAHWDQDAAVWSSESDIEGLHIETETLAEFYDLVEEFARELIVTNHYSDEDLSRKDMRKHIPAVLISHKDGPPRAA
ncbi:MAG: DUF1902 domain-containing protein [Pseudomonadota bacterium]